jgi:hypothetical protein
VNTILDTLIIWIRELQFSQKTTQNSQES